MSDQFSKNGPWEKAEQAKSRPTFFDEVKRIWAEEQQKEEAKRVAKQTAITNGTYKRKKWPWVVAGLVLLVAFWGRGTDAELDGYCKYRANLVAYDQAGAGNRNWKGAYNDYYVHCMRINQNRELPEWWVNRPNR